MHSVVRVWSVNFDLIFLPFVIGLATSIISSSGSHIFLLNSHFTFCFYRLIRRPKKDQLPTKIFCWIRNAGNIVEGATSRRRRLRDLDKSPINQKLFRVSRNSFPDKNSISAAVMTPVANSISARRHLAAFHSALMDI